MINTTILEYNNSIPEQYRQLGEALMNEIGMNLPEATAKIYHASPVWFINDNPIAGYWLSKTGMQLLFWSGQSFVTPGLKPIGKHKAAGITYKSINEVDLELIQKWLQESKHIQWDYKHIRQNDGKLVEVKPNKP